MARKSKYLTTVLPVQETNRCARAGHYGRLSVEDGDDIEKNSIGNQRKIADDFVSDREDVIITEYYADNGFSGMNYNRPGFQRMMEDLRSGKIDCVIVKDISRFGRHFLLTSEYVERTLPKMGVRLICINDHYDSADENADTTSLLLPIKMMMNDNYARDISKKIRGGINAKMSSGEYLPSASSIPYGYLRNPQENTYDIDPEAAQIVVRIFQMRAAGEKLNAIARSLNEDGVLSPGRLRYVRGVNKAEKNKTALWERGTIRKILNDRVYLGERIHGKVKRDKLGAEKLRRPESAWTVVEDAHQALVSENLFEAAQTVNQQELEARANYKKCAAVGEDYRQLFRGKIYCGECGSTMSGAKGCARENAKTPSRVFFDCNAYRYSNHTRCESHYIRQEVLMKAVIDLIHQQAAVAVDVDRLIQEIRNDPAASRCLSASNDRLASIRVKKGNIQAKLEQLIIHRIEGVLDAEEYACLKETYNLEYERLAEEERTVMCQETQLDHQIDSAKKWINALKRYQRIPVVDRELLDLLIDKIYVFSDKRIRIELKYKDPFAPFMEFLEEVREVDKRVG